MVGVVTTLSTLKPQSVDSQVEVRASAEYLINTDCITEMYVHDSTDTLIHYKFNVEEDRPGEFIFTVNETNAAIVTLSDAAPNNPTVPLDVFDGIQNFDMIPNVSSTTGWNFNVADIVWGEDDSTGAYCRIWIKKGGKEIVPYILDHTIAQVVGWADEGTTAA